LLFPLPPERFDTNCSLVLFKTARALTLASVPRSLTTRSANTVGNDSLLRLATGTRTCYTRMTLYHALYLRHNLLCVFGLDSFLRNIVTLTTLQIGSTVEQLLVTGIRSYIALRSNPFAYLQCFSASSSDLPLVWCQFLSFDYAVLSIINKVLKIQKLDAKHMPLPLSSWIFKRPDSDQ
jgi:hypothetical protein